MPKTMISSRFVLYARVSTDEQASDNHFSIDAQINEMQEFVKKKGGEVAGIFIDEGISGTKRDRPQLNALLETARNHGFDILLVHELSRLSRSVYHTLDIFDYIGHHGIGFASVKDPEFDFADPSKRLFLTILAAINEYYINLLKLHTSKSKRERARQGLYNSSITPFGYLHEGSPKDPPKIIEEEAEVVRIAYDQYATGRYSHLEIAELLNKAGHRTRPSSKKPKGGRFSKDTVAEMLRNPFYMGKVVYHKHIMSQSEIFEGLHKPIVTPELWEKCQNIRTDRRTSSRAVQKPYRVYLLSNLASCNVCHRKLRSQNASIVTYYRETSYERGYIDCPHGKIGTRTEAVDQQINAIIESIQLPENWLDEVSQRLGDDEELDHLRHQRESLEAERRRLKEMKILGEFDDDTDLYYTEIARIRRDLDNLPSYDELEGLKIAVQSVQSLKQTWANSPLVDRRELVHLILREVAVDVPNSRVVSVTPQAVFIPIFREIPMLSERDFGTFVPIWNPEQAAGQDREKIVTIPQLSAITVLPDQRTAAPFVADNPLTAEAGSRIARIAPGISRAMVICKERNDKPEIVIQAKIPGRPLLPLDLRKWPAAEGNIKTSDEIRTHPDESMDVLITPFWLWENAVSTTPQNTDDLLAEAYRLLSPNGVWYTQEALPRDMPAHWFYQYFPNAWQIVRSRTWDLYTLYNQLQTVGFTPQVKQHIYYQPVSLGAALEMVSQRAGFLAILGEREYHQGLDKLNSAVDRESKDKLIGSEIALVDVWAQKMVREALIQP